MAPRISLYIRDTFTAIRRNGLIAFAAVSTAFIALFLLGFALLIRQEFNLLVDQFQANVEVSVYLSDTVSPDQQQNLQQTLQAMPEVKTVRFESKDEAYQRFLRLFHNQPDLVNNVSSDALPASFRVKLVDPQKFPVIKARLQGQPGIDTIVDLRAFYDRLFQVTNVFKVGGWALALIMLICSTALIGNTVRMAVFDRRQEIGIMRLVGATNWRIRVPFLIEALVEALLGAGVAVAALFLTQRLFVEPLSHQLTFFALIDAQNVLLTVPILVLASVFVAVVAGMVATSRWLEV
jgi:cell division transport system permease protein